MARHGGMNAAADPAGERCPRERHRRCASGGAPENEVMGNRGATFAKRQREQARRDRAREKAQKRAERPRAERAPGGGDPDIDWIVPGPQPGRDRD
jgi:hypothetical protein